jgi:putative transposase
MAKRLYSPEETINKLFEAEILLNQGTTIGEASKKTGITEQTYYRWRKEYGGMRIEQTKRLKDMEKENDRLKKLVADISLDNTILKEAAEGNFYAHPGDVRSSLKYVESLVFLKGGLWSARTSRETQRYISRDSSANNRLVDRIVELATQYGRYGYRQITALLQQEGRQVKALSLSTKQCYTADVYFEMEKDILAERQETKSIAIKVRKVYTRKPIEARTHSLNG